MLVAVTAAATKCGVVDLAAVETSSGEVTGRDLKQNPCSVCTTEKLPDVNVN